MGVSVHGVPVGSNVSRVVLTEGGAIIAQTDTAYEHSVVDGVTSLAVAFAGGPPFSQSQVLEGVWNVSSSSAVFATSALNVPAWVISQLEQRNKTYAVQWKQGGHAASTPSSL